MKILKGIIKLIMVSLLVLFVAITIFFLTFDLNSYKGIITSKASRAIGRTVTIDKMSMKLSLIPTIEIKGIKIAHDDSFEDKTPLLEIDSVDATLALLPLLESKVEIESFNMTTAKVTLIEKNGRNNFTLGKKDQIRQAKPLQKNGKSQDDVFKTIANVLAKLSIENISIDTLGATYTNDNTKHSLSLMDVSIRQLKWIKMTVVYNKKTIKTEINLGNFASFMSRNPNYSFSATLEAFDAKMNLSGTIGNTVKFEKMLFNVSVEGKNLKKVVDNFVEHDKVPSSPFAINLIAKGNLNGKIKLHPLTVVLGENIATLSADVTLSDIMKNMKIAFVGDAQISDAQLAQKYGIKPMAVSMNVGLKDQKVTVNKMMFSAGKSDVTMNGVMVLSDVPTIKTQIVSQYFDIFDFINNHSEQSVVSEKETEQNDKTNLFSDDKIDFSVLKTINAQFATTAQYVKLPYVDNVGVALSGDLKDGLLNIPAMTLRTPLGSVQGTVQLDATQTPVKVQMDMQSDELKLDAIKVVAEQVSGADVFATVNLKTQGDSVKTFVSALDGHILLEMTQGDILNRWFNSLPLAMGLANSKAGLVNLTASEQNSELVCGAVNLGIDKGVITSDNQIAVETSVIDLSVSGKIDLPNEELSLTMLPSLSDTDSSVQDVLSLTKIIKVSGPLTQPTFSVDTKTAVENGLGALAGQVAQKAGIQLPEAQTESVRLCEKVLGSSLRSQSEKTTQPVLQIAPEVSQKSVTETNTKEVIKQQLFDSFIEALKK